MRELHRPVPVLVRAPRLRASDSSTVRSSGSPMSRKLSPSSSGIGLSDGGAVRGAFSMRRLNRALPQLDPRHRLVAEEAVHPLDDLGDHVLDQRRVRGQHDQLEDAVALLARREADRLGRADPGVARADDLGPAGDHARLDEAEAAERGAADLRHQLGDRLAPGRRAGARRACAVACLGCLGSRVAFHRAPRPCHSARDGAHSGLAARCSPGTTATPARCRGARAPGERRRPIPTACGCPR